jgi:outer membrane lipoprotein-sorting protein
MYFDQGSYRFRKMTVTSNQQGPKGPMHMNMVMMVKNEAVNTPIPDSAFKFVPPPGAKEMKGGMMPGMGMPGMGAPRPRPGGPGR